MMGLKLGKRFKELGAKEGRETIRALPMAVADLVQETFEDEAIRGPLATRGVLYTSMGAWATGTAAVFLNDSAGNDGGAPGTAVFAKGGTGALAARPRGSAARSFGVDIRTGVEVVEIRTKDERVRGRHHRRRHADRRAPGRLGRRPQDHAAPVRPGRAGAAPDVAHGQHPPARRDRQGQPGAVGPARLRRRRLGGAARRAGSRSGLSIDHVERAMDAFKYGHVAEEPILEATIPRSSDPSLAPDGKHVMSIVFQAAPRHLRDGDWASERDRVGDIAVKTMERFAPGLRRAGGGAPGHHARGPGHGLRPRRRARLSRRARLWISSSPGAR